MSLPGEAEGLTRDDVLDNITITWLTNTALSGARLYWENKARFFSVKGVSVPIAVSVFPDEIDLCPRSWAERAYPKLIHYNKLDKGGHFAAWEQPKLFSEEVRAGFRSLRSRTASAVQEEIMKLAGKKALITGGNSGIGLATARLFISEGAEVAITGRDQKTLDEAVAELGSKAHGYRADVTVAEDRKKLFAGLAKDFGKLDIVFANAGISGRTPTGTTDEAIFEKVVHTNLNGAFFTVNSAAPLMNDNGSIIFNGSVQSYLGQPGLAAYAATKGGLVSMARSIAADLAPRKIRVNVVAPGATKTPIWKRGPRANATAEESAKVSDFFSSTVPLARWGEPEELAKAVLFLASDDSSYINAVELMVDGGLTGAPFGAAILRA